MQISTLMSSLGTFKLKLIVFWKRYCLVYLIGWIQMKIQSQFWNVCFQVENQPINLYEAVYMIYLIYSMHPPLNGKVRIWFWYSGDPRRLQSFGETIEVIESSNSECWPHQWIQILQQEKNTKTNSQIQKTNSQIQKTNSQIQKTNSLIHKKTKTI